MVFVLTDDQDMKLGRHDYTRLGSLEIMPQVPPVAFHLSPFVSVCLNLSPFASIRLHCSPLERVHLYLPPFQVQEKLIDQGAFMENYFVNTPICCPSRTEFFTGRYFHNVGPPNDNKGTCMHADTTMAGSNTTGLFGLMTRAGYNTGVFGKVTNDQGPILHELALDTGSAYIDSPLLYNDYNGNK